jgi:hypothetical protein
MNNFYVYVYLNPLLPGKYIYRNYKFDFEPMYIGRGKHNRINTHINLSAHDTSTRFYAKLKQLIKLNIEPIRFKIHDNLDINEANNIEINLIKLIGRKVDCSGPLYNITSGGEGGDTFTNNPNREIIRQKYLNKIPWNKGLIGKGICKSNKNSFNGIDSPIHEPAFIEKRLNGLRALECKLKMKSKAINRNHPSNGKIYEVLNNDTNSIYYIYCAMYNRFIGMSAFKFDHSEEWSILNIYKISDFKSICEINNLYSVMQR